MEIARTYLLEETAMPYDNNGGEEYVFDVNQVSQLARILGKLESDVKQLHQAVTKLTTKVEEIEKRLIESEIKTKIAAGIVTLTISVISGLIGYFMGK